MFQELVLEFSGLNKMIQLLVFDDLKKGVLRILIVVLFIGFEDTVAKSDDIFSKNINNSIQSVGENSITLTTIFGD